MVRAQPREPGCCLWIQLIQHSVYRFTCIWAAHYNASFTEQESVMSIVEMLHVYWMENCERCDSYDSTVDKLEWLELNPENLDAVYGSNWSNTVSTDSHASGQPIRIQVFTEQENVIFIFEILYVYAMWSCKIGCVISGIVISSKNFQSIP